MLLGLSAAFGGPWVERRGPRVAAFTAAMFFGSGLVIGGIGLAFRQSVLVFLGMGVIAGIGCGLGYISPVSTLVKWFPDRRGMATGMAIMGFGGGAFIAGTLNVLLIDALGVANTVIALGLIYMVIMVLGSRLMRSPPPDWRPPGWTPKATVNPMIAARSVTRNEALGTPQFYLLWGILFINVTAGIGILAQASPMMQDMFSRTPLEAAAVVSLISVFNASGRFLWASGVRLHRAPPHVHHLLPRAVHPVPPDSAARRPRGVALFQISLFAVFTMYGGGFATIPAFLADFSDRERRGHSRATLTAWSAAAMAGPVIITELSSRAKAALPPGADRIHIYDTPLQVLAALLALGFGLTLLVRPLRVRRP